MLKRSLLALVLIIVLSAHDMYLKLDTYFFSPNSEASIKLFNGTFEQSDNVIDRDRMVDISLVGNGKRIAVDTTQWSEIEQTTVLNFTTGEAGTWVAGVSTAARNIEMSAEDFNDYLEHDGVLDMLEWRKTNNALNQAAVEKYSKHVKTIFQVGDQLSEDWKVNLEYPIEFIPLNNPYDLHPGHEMSVKLLFKGEPLANQLVYIGSEVHSHDDTHTHDKSEGHAHTHSPDEGDEHDSEEQADHHHELASYRTDEAGILTFKISHQGIWYLRTIHLILSEEEGLTHESNWATLTFEVSDGHTHSHDESHDHDTETSGIPNYFYLLGSLIFIVVLFLWFNRKNT